MGPISYVAPTHRDLDQHSGHTNLCSASHLVGSTRQLLQTTWSARLAHCDQGATPKAGRGGSSNIRRRCTDARKGG